jgi:hypothetical protein
MLFEQYPPQDLLIPSINDGGINKLKSSLTSLDFYLLDDIDAYLSPIHSNTNTNDLNNDSLNENSQPQEDFFPDFDFSDINNLEEKSDFIPLDEIELEKWISQSSFPSPPMDTDNSPLSQVEDASSTLSWFGDEYPINTDMIVPLSPPLSASSSSPGSITKKTKLSPGERRLRKKGQNKTAAEKYRIKKKSERNQLLDRHLKLKTLNKELKSELENLTYRIQQFKQLFNEFVQTN